MQQPVGFEALQKIAVVLHRLQERAVGQADAVQIEGLRLRLYGVLYGSGSGRGGERGHGGSGDKLAASEVHSGTAFHYEPICNVPAVIRLALLEELPRCTVYTPGAISQALELTSQ